MSWRGHRLPDWQTVLSLLFIAALLFAAVAIVVSAFVTPET